ncbi:MAG: hypothetical protein M3P94_06930 [Chloroflexota bacterium]|nr:hypothetical protein [Chloroflexota bacterium]
MIFDPPVQTIIENIPAMRRLIIVNSYARLTELAKTMRLDAQKSATWKDHPKRHKSAKYPSSKTARENLVSGARMAGAEEIEVWLGHSEETIYMGGKNAPHNYGLFLETAMGGDYAIVQPTLKKFEPLVLKSLQGVMYLPGRGAKNPKV